MGYCNGIRKTICVIPKEIKDRESLEQFKLDKNDVVVVSGGGRGIILECVKGLAELYNPKIIITGRTDLPKGDEDTTKLAKYIKDTYGEVTGIINGAGLPSFGTVPKKNEEFALKVVRVKANGFYNMYNKLNSDKLKFFVSMGAISGRFGMDGQVDYSAGADIIVKLSSMINKDNPNLKCGVLGWTAWDEVGMASDPQVQKVQKEVRGLDYIKVKEGVTRFLNEIAFGLDYPEMLFFGQIGKGNMPLGQLDLLDENLKTLTKYIGENGEVTDRTVFPMIDEVKEYKAGKSISSIKELNKECDVHLKDHLVDGSSVFAGVMHIESACELGELLQDLSEDNTRYYASEILRE